MVLQFQKYINHPIVQDRIRIYHIKKILDKLTHIKSPHIDIKNNTVYINRLSPEDKISIHKHKKSILDLTNKRISTIGLNKLGSIRMG